MRNKPSSVEVPSIHPDGSINKTGRQEETQTESSVYECYQKIHIREEVCKSRINTIEKRLNDITGKYALQVKQERVIVNRLKEKTQILINDQERDIIEWKNSVDEMEKAAQQLMRSLKDQQLIRLAKIRQKSESVLNLLLNKLQLLRKEQKIFQNQAHIKVRSFKELNAEQRIWIKQNLKQNHRIKEIKQAISKCCADLKREIQDEKNRAEREYEQMKLRIEQLKRLLLNFLKEQKIKRETRKEEILQTFERILLRKDFKPKMI